MSTENPLPSKLAGLFDRLFSKVFKKSLDIPGIEMLHQITFQMSNAILAAAERRSLEKCKRLNDATKKGFRAMAEELDDLQATNKILAEGYEKVAEGFALLREKLDRQGDVNKRLEERTQFLEDDIKALDKEVVDLTTVETCDAEQPEEDCSS